MSVSKINLCSFQKMNTKRNIRQKRGRATTGDNQVPPQARGEGVAMPVNPAWLTLFNP